MRNRHLSLLIVTLSLLAIVAVSGAGAPAFGAPCGGVVPCSCGDTVTADRTLVCGVDPVTTTVCPGDGLIMDTDGVALNLNFCTIRGDGDNIGTGIVIDADAVVVRSGRITGFGVGVATVPMIGTTDGSTLTGLNIYDNGAGIHIMATNTAVKNNLVRLNDSHGITVLVPMVMGPHNNTVSGNRSEDNGFDGVVVHGAMNTVTGNFAQRNGGDGFEIGGQATVKQNRAKYNALEGFVISGQGHWVTLNEAHMNGTDGFTVSANMSRFDRNRSDYNGDFGIREVMAVGNAYTANRCTGNQDGPSSPAGLCK
jgi:parallel beta-helix repeat protein